MTDKSKDEKAIDAHFDIYGKSSFDLGNAREIVAEINKIKRVHDLRETAAYYRMEEAFEWREWPDKIPALNFPSHWFVQIIPPFSGAIVRFRVSLNRDMKDSISIYLDCYSMLGYFGHGNMPYWEIYPYGGDTYRCAMEETDKLLKAIDQALRGEYAEEVDATEI